MQADASIDKETRDDALQDLQERIDDWKQLQIMTFGELLLLGSFSVLKDSTLRSDEKEYHIYLFSRILIMCKDVNASKPKNRLANARQTSSMRGKSKMNLKGRIYFTNVTAVTPQSTPGNYSLQISWKGEPAVETFIIKFRSDETLQKWHTMIETQRSSCILEARTRGTSDTQLLSLQGMNMENPYLHSQDEDEDYSRISGTTTGGTDTTGYSEFIMSRNASSTSLRSRSATGGSGGSNRPMRVPTSEMGGLTLNTRGLPAQSPQDYPGTSYFSPVDRDSSIPPQSSISSRSSSQSAFAGYNRGTTPVSAGLYRPEESHRNTAPAMARGPNGQMTGNPYLSNGVRPRGPPSAGGMGPLECGRPAAQMSILSSNRVASTFRGSMPPVSRRFPRTWRNRWAVPIGVRTILPSTTHPHEAAPHISNMACRVVCHQVSVRPSRITDTPMILLMVETRGNQDMRRHCHRAEPSPLRYLPPPVMAIPICQAS